MWIVRLALNRPYTFVVAAMLIVILGVVSIVSTPTDIFPNINIPVVSVIFSYAGLPPEEVATRITAQFERGATTTVNDIEHIESQSLNGMAIIKIFFQPNANINGAVAQVTAISQTLLRSLPPGSTPPLVITYNASSVPILQISLSSSTMSEQQLNDLGMNFIRTQLATIEGAAIPYPYGGKMRQISVELNPQTLLEKHVSGADVVSAVNAQNLILPEGTVKIGDREYNVQMNSSPKTVGELNDLPVKVVNGAMVYVRDVAYVHDGAAFQTNIVRENGRRGSLMMVMKSGNASTLSIVDAIRAALPRIESTLPPGIDVRPTADQSIFVRAAVNGVVKEAITAACLTAAMILIFLGSWRSTVVVAISIPLSILTSLTLLSFLGETINIMTLGGLALAVGILVDDATVALENISRLIPQGRSLRDTVLLGAQQIAMPAFVATLSICIVFVPIFFMTGIPGYLFRPLAEAVVFAMLASYVLSRTLVPTMVLYFFRSERKRAAKNPQQGPGWFRRFHAGFEERFEGLRERYVKALGWCLDHRLAFVLLFLGFCGGSMMLVPFLGSDLFPKVDAGQIRLHLRAPTGTRVEETAALCDRVEQTVRRQIPPAELAGIVDNVGVPYSGINLSYSTSGTIGTSDAEIMISLREHHHPTPNYVRDLRETLPQEFPGTSFFFQPADIISQILNFGLSAPIDIQFVGPNQEANYELARRILPRIRAVAGATDVHIHQLFDLGQLDVDVDRTKAEGMGMTQRDVANNTLAALTTSFQTSPNFWLSPQGVTYQVTTMTPQYRVDSMRAVQAIPVIGGAGPPQVLDNVATIRRSAGAVVVNHYDVMPVIDILAAAQGRDLGGVSSDIKKVLKEFEGQLPRGTTVEIRGQVSTMNSSFESLGIGLVFSILLVYLLMVVNFQSWTDPFIILTGLSAAFAGIVWILFITHTTLSVPSLMGAIMCIGVATSNSILLVTFAGAEMQSGRSSVESATSAGYTRLRPIIMTALAMIIGMLPMSLGLGEGGEQNAALGRAVIGGLSLATVGTLFFVPVVYSLMREKGYKELLAETEE